MNDLAGKHIVLGLTGGIACYKAAELCHALVKEGATVQVVMTESATQFITAVMNCSAASVITTCTVAPSLMSDRQSSAAL